jgi:hypothetical protein
MIKETPDGLTVDLTAHRVEQVAVDYAFSLTLRHDEHRVTIRVEGPFQLRRGDRVDDMDPEARPGELGPALELSRATGTAATVRKTGELEIVFGDGSILSVPSDPAFEAWTLTVTGGPMIVSGPGGVVTTFSSGRT